MSIEKITLGAGCFWCVENIFARIKGVVSVTSGYADGDIINPSYEQVCSGDSHHAEVVQITFNPAQLSVEQLLTVFFAIHDPTTLNRQGDDIGSQYRSTILFHNLAQQEIAETKIAQLHDQQCFENPIVTLIKAENNFYSAEDYHQDYVTNNPENKYCQLVVAKKIQKFLSEFAHLLKDENLMDEAS
ncbi:peptide-methionine (S)-S-oxide reductase MsrA [Cognaticolwellia beringensis]|uniref:Peptide methionine sulfoxide reductase MsrA n=1 Tax=Cognaticolwellia beringensis TaxID=1967665 RepID=A0A222G465_9GAMM|nr:peptide-methionine (S)-S-oxide reductase MsrA [Cognaticolwellia beringensis]ASP46707.1 peptide-methionine (S)-S-oxide reductase [Cognaticolwellia beringensis]